MTGTIMKTKKDTSVRKFRFSGRIVSSLSPADDISALPVEKRRWMQENRHKLEYREIMAVIAGKCEIKLKNKYFCLYPGDILLVDPMEEHTNGHYPEKGTSFWWGAFWTDMLRSQLWEENRITDSYAVPMGAFNDFIYHIWNDLLAGDTPDIREEIANIITLLINNRFRTGMKKMIFSQANEQDQIMEKIIQYMEEMPSLNCSLTSLALLAGYSKVHFQRIFIEYTGMTFREYLLRVRVKRYFRLYGNEDHSLKEMADELGFSSVAALLHWKKHNAKALHH